jgi:hypothetical protein
MATNEISPAPTAEDNCALSNDDSRFGLRVGAIFIILVSGRSSRVQRGLALEGYTPNSVCGHVGTADRRDR